MLYFGLLANKPTCKEVSFVKLIKTQLQKVFFYLLTNMTQKRYLAKTSYLEASPVILGKYAVSSLPIGACEEFCLWPKDAPHTAPHILNIAHCTLHNTHCMLHNTHCTLHNTHCTLHNTHCTLHNTHCTLHNTYCTLRNTNCTLHTGLFYRLLYIYYGDTQNCF